MTGQNGRHYSGIPDDVYVVAAGGRAELREFYAAAGVDYEGTISQRYAVEDWRANQNVMMYKIQVLPRGASPVPMVPGTTVPAGSGDEFANGSAADPLGVAVLGGLALWAFSGSGSGR